MSDKPKRYRFDINAKLDNAIHQLPIEQFDIAEWRISPLSQSLLNYAYGFKHHFGGAQSSTIYGCPVVIDNALGAGIIELVAGDTRITIQLEAQS